MKINIKTAILSVLIIFLSLSFSKISRAQQWASSMQDPDISFFEAQRQFNEYFKDKPYEKGKGWKQFKRWEYFMQDRVDSNGFFTHANATYKVYTDIQKNYYNNTEKGQGTAGKWVPIGPFGSTSSSRPGAGRLNCIAFHPTNKKIMIAGAASGGIWYTKDGGLNWNTNTDDLAALGISSIEFSKSNPQVVYAATGDRDGSDTYSIGVLKSTDGGKTWSQTGLNWTVQMRRFVSKVLVHPTNANIVYASTTFGIYKTTDGGTNWVRLRAGSYRDMEFKPGDPNTIYAATKTGIIRTTNGGSSFSTLSISFATTVARVELAVTEDAPNYLYVVAGKASDGGFAGLYLSTNAGNSFTTQSTTPNLLGWQTNGMDSGGQAWYDLAIAVSPSDKNIVLVGGVNIWRSVNGGVSWTNISHWQSTSSNYVHADIHELRYANDKTTVWASSDGGAHRGLVNGNSWAIFNDGMAIAQMYRMGASTSTEKNILTGWQDNGTSRYNGSWYKVLGGDGMECIIDYNNNNIMYASLYYGQIYRSANGGANWTKISNSINEQGGWVTPYIMHPNASNILYAGYKNVYKTVNKGASWTKLTNFSGSNNIKALAIAPSNPSIMYLSTTYDVKRSTDGGQNWTSIASGIGNGSVTSFAIHPTNPNTVWVSLNGYYSGYKVMKTTNGGQSWLNVSGNLPNIPANVVVYEKNSANGIYVGTDAGIFYTNDNLGQWVPFMKDLPNVIVYDMEIFYPAHKIRAATFGRGMWESPVYDLANDINTTKFDEYRLKVFPNPASDVINIDLSSIEHHDAQIRIMNNSGQVIRYIDYQNASSPAINVKELAAGIYFIEVQIGKKFYFGKFIRQ
jgi:photosystem II stability/assembly factor-like uncharacterized protein